MPTLRINADNISVTAKMCHNIWDTINLIY